MGIAAPVSAVLVTYTLVGFSSGSNTLNGSITINDADLNSLIIQPEVTAWSLTASGTPQFSLDSTAAFANFGCSSDLVTWCFSIVGNQLIFPFERLVGDPERYARFGDGTGNFVQFQNGRPGLGLALLTWYENAGPVYQSIVSRPPLIGIAAERTVPATGT